MVSPLISTFIGWTTCSSSTLWFGHFWCPGDLLIGCLLSYCKKRSNPESEQSSIELALNGVRVSAERILLTGSIARKIIIETITMTCCVGNSGTQSVTEMNQ